VTLYLNLRAQAVAGGIVDPYLLRGDGTGFPPALSAVPWAEIAGVVAGRNLLLVAHGFNVNYEEGARSLGQLERRLALAPSDLLVGVLWPGDFWIPVVNYPFEGDDANVCGSKLAAFCNAWFGPAQSLSFASHSLGGRVMLQAARDLGRRARSLCLTAAAIDRDCLTEEYAAAADNADRIAVLASHEDMVLKVAFRLGDPISDLLRDGSISAERALGYDGPPAVPAPPVAPPWQIPDQADYGHGNYLPPSDRVQTAAEAEADKWSKSADFMGRAFRGLPQTWP
jgi:hypothetical protein